MSQTPERTIRNHRFLCRRCRRTWATTYELVAYHDADGDHELFYHHGVPVSPPWARPACPYCGGLRVVLLPTVTPVSDTGPTP